MPASHITVEAVFQLTGRVSVEDIRDVKDFKAYAENGILYISGLSSTSQKFPSSLKVYNLPGALIYQGVTAGDSAEIPLPGRGVYIVTDGTTVVKVTH